MTLSNQQLAGELAQKILSLDEKVKFLDFAKKNPTIGCRKLIEIFLLEKTIIANIVKEEKNIHSQHEIFHEKSKTQNHPDKYQKNNEILYKWYHRCCALTFIQMDQC